MSKVLKVFLIFGICLSFFSLANATTITYQANDLGSGSWEYLYTVTNNTLALDIEEFTVYFGYGLYSNLSIDNPKVDWDELTIQPDLVLGVPVRGYYDALASVLGIAPGLAETGFRVSFTWLGTGTPMDQAFDIVDALTFETLDSGNTIPAPTDAVPEPSTLLLFISGCPLILLIKRRLLQRRETRRII